MATSSQSWTRVGSWRSARVGTRYSRARVAMWLATPPTSVTMALAVAATTTARADSAADQARAQFEQGIALFEDGEHEEAAILGHKILLLDQPPTVQPVIIENPGSAVKARSR